MDQIVDQENPKGYLLFFIQVRIFIDDWDKAKPILFSLKLNCNFSMIFAHALQNMYQRKKHFILLYRLRKSST